MTVYKASDKYLYSEIDSEAVILDVNSGTYFGLNEVSNRIWQLLQNPTDSDDLIAKIVEEYEVAPEQAAEDVESLLKDMFDAGLIEVVNEQIAQVS